MARKDRVMTQTSTTPKTRRYDLEERTAAWAHRVRVFCREARTITGNKEDCDQLVRSSGSVASNYIEANEPLGAGDFAMRIRITLKESKESRLWLSLLYIPESKKELEKERLYLMDHADQFVKIFSSILRSFKENRKIKH